MSFAARVHALCAAHPDARAVEFEQRWTTWGDVGGWADALEELLDAAGVGARDAVGLVVRERPPAIAALLGLLARSRPVVVIQSIASDAEVRADVARLELAAVVAEARDWARDGFVACVAAAGAVGVSLGDVPGEVGAVPGTRATPTRHPVTGADVAVRVPTSGTSGVPRRHTVTVATVDGAGTAAGVKVRDPEDARARRSARCRCRRSAGSWAWSGRCGAAARSR